MNKLKKMQQEYDHDSENESWDASEIDKSNVIILLLKYKVN
jgi:hypothetical protein